MHDLRRQALESGKTVSKKARSKQSSGGNSRSNSAANSRVGSKNVSRAGSDDEEGGNLSDETSFRYARVDFATQNALRVPHCPCARANPSIVLTRSTRSWQAMNRNKYQTHGGQSWQTG